MNTSFNTLPQRRELVSSTITEVVNANQFEILDSRTKRNKPSLEYFLQAITYYFSYEKILKFNAGIYNVDFRTTEFFDKDQQLIGSGLNYSVEPTGIDIIKKTKDLFNPSNENISIEVPLLCLKASEIVEDYAPENFQELIDNTIGAFPSYEDKEEYESRNRFNFLVAQNIERALIRYGESREQTTRELVHNNFRNRIEKVLKTIPGIIITDNSESYALKRNSIKFLNEFNNVITHEERRIQKQNLENELKKFDSYKKGVSKEELIESQIRRDRGEKVNAPQIYRTKDLKMILTKLLNYKINNRYIKFSKSEIFELFQRDLERYGQTFQRPKEYDLDNYINNNEFKNFLNENYDVDHTILLDSDVDKTSQEQFLFLVQESQECNSMYCYAFFTQVVYAHDGKINFKDLNNLENTCSIDTLERELKTNEKKRFEKFVKICFSIDIKMENNQMLGQFLQNQKRHIENVLLEMSNPIEFVDALIILKDTVLNEFVDIEELEVGHNE